jgi:hypothetical protein
MRLFWLDWLSMLIMIINWFPWIRYIFIGSNVITHLHNMPDKNNVKLLPRNVIVLIKEWNHHWSHLTWVHLGLQLLKIQEWEIYVRSHVYISDFIGIYYDFQCIMHVILTKKKRKRKGVFVTLKHVIVELTHT